MIYHHIVIAEGESKEIEDDWHVVKAWLEQKDFHILLKCPEVEEWRGLHDSILKKKRS